MVAGQGADALEQRARGVEIDGVALVEIRLGLARDSCCEVKDDVGAVSEKAGRGTGIGKVRRDRVGLSGEGGKWRGGDVGEREAGDGAGADGCVGGDPLGELSADHAARAEDQDVHGVRLLLRRRERRAGRRQRRQGLRVAHR